MKSWMSLLWSPPPKKMPVILLAFSTHSSLCATSGVLGEGVIGTHYLRRIGIHSTLATPCFSLNSST